MKLEIKNKKENKLLNRTEIEGVIGFEGVTPSLAEVKKKVADELKAELDLVVVKHVYTRFGGGEADFLAYVYGGRKALEGAELFKRKKKEKKPKGEKKEEKETKEEKKVEKEKPEKGEEKEKEKPGEKEKK